MMHTALTRAISAALVVGLVWLGSSGTAHAQLPTGVNAWLVVPFEVTEPSARTYWFGEGVAVLIADGLEDLGRQVVPRDSRVEALDALRLPPAVTLSRATYIRVAELLRAGSAIFGTIVTDEQAITIRARAVHLETGQQGEDITEQGKLTDLFAICRRVALRLAGHDPARSTSTTRTAPAPLDAFEAYTKALLTERPEARVRLLEAALDRAPNYDRIRLALWDARSALGQHAKALDALQPIREQSPLAPAARFSAALSLIELGRLDEAFRTLREFADARPHAAVLNNLGVVQLRRGWTPQTGRPTYYFTKAAEMEPDDGDVFFNLGYAYWQERDPQGAIYWLREGVRRNPADADAHFVLAAALDTTGASAEAARERGLAQQLSARYAERSRKSSPTEVPRGLERIQDSLSPLHPMRFDVALAAAAQRNQQELVTFHLERARRMFAEHKDGSAEPELRRVLFLSPYHAEAHLLLGRIYLRSGRVHEATSAFRIAVWSEDTAAGRVALAEALLEARDTAGARHEVLHALDLEPQSPDAKALLAKIDAQSAR